MPTFLLYIKADLENIAKIDVPLGHSFCIDVSNFMMCSLQMPACANQQFDKHSSVALEHLTPAVEATSLCCLHCYTQVKESAGSETRERVHVTAAETHDMSGSKGTANFVMKFAKDSRHECSINVMQLKGVTRAVTGTAQLEASSCSGGAVPQLSCKQKQWRSVLSADGSMQAAGSNMQGSRPAMQGEQCTSAAHTVVILPTLHAAPIKQKLLQLRLLLQQ